MTSWIPNLYLKNGKRRDYNSKYLEQLTKDGKALLSTGVPVIFSLAHLAKIVDVPFGKLHEVVLRRVEPYRVFNIRKRSGGHRPIAVPEPFLMRTQRWINQNILLKTKVHTCSKAYRPKCSPIKNAEVHCGARWLIKLDIVSFFESIDERQIYKVFRGLGYRALLAFELARLTTRDVEHMQNGQDVQWINSKLANGIPYPPVRVGTLPQGAPTSPGLANSVCYQMDVDLFAVAQTHGATYTRYADDIVISGCSDFSRQEATKILKQCLAVLRKHNFKRNDQKTHIVPPGSRKIVTGLLVHGSRPSLNRDFRERIEMHLYYAKRFGVAEHCQRRRFFSIIGFHDHLRGLITYAHQVDPSLGKKYEQEFSSLQWPMHF